VIPELGGAAPYGVYDLAQNSGWVSVGVDHDTASFAVETIRRWWHAMGQEKYPRAQRLLITADGGGSNGSRLRLWKLELQKLADETGLAIAVSHFPPGTSKWNKIEHRLFSFISKNWRGQPLTSLKVIVNLIAGTTTKKGLKVHAEFLKPVRKRLRELTGQPEQLTLVFDAGASSRQNLEGLERYVTAVRPSYHLALLSEAAGHLAEVQLSNGAAVRAWRTQRTVAGKQRDVAVVFSPQLYEGQLRGLRQTLSRSWRELEEMQLHPPVSVEAAKRKLDKIRRHQYLRSLLCYEITRDGQGPIRIRLWSDWQEYQRLITRYFGLRILITDRAEWSTAQIVEAYRGQSKVEAAFRNLKDPHMLSTRPQFHWTDQKLHV